MVDTGAAQAGAGLQQGTVLPFPDGTGLFNPGVGETIVKKPGRLEIHYQSLQQQLRTGSRAALGTITRTAKGKPVDDPL